MNIYIRRYCGRFLVLSQMNNSDPVTVYENVVKMFGYRQFTVTSAILNADDVNQRLNNYEYVTIMGSRKNNPLRPNGLAIAILIAPESNYASKSQDFKKLLKGLPKPSIGENLEVIFISNEPLTSYLKNHMIQFKSESANASMSISLEDHTYEIFMLEAPKHAYVPKHQIATPEEINKICTKYYTSPENFPRILSTDTQAVWLGVQPGMVVKIIRPSENAGKSVEYRICVKG